MSTDAGPLVVQPTRSGRLAMGPRWRRPEWGVALVFAVSGAVQASWMARLPAVSANLRLDLAQLGFALFAMGTGSLVSMPPTGRLCRRFGSRRVVLVAALVTCASLAELGRVSSTLELRLVLLCLGLGAGAWDAAMNLQGVAVERTTGGHRMPMFHGFWSAGSVLGAGFGVVAARLPLPISTHFAVAAVAGAVGCWLGVRAFEDERRLPAGQRPARGTPVLRRMLLLGLLIACGAAIEGAAGDWLAVYLADTRGASHAGAAGGYALFLTASAIGRFLAGAVQRRVGRARTIRFGAGLAAVGVAVSVAAPATIVTYAGVGCWGLGICVVFPAVLSAGGRSGSGDSVAVLTTVGYVAAFVAPPLIGTGGQRIGLGYALLELSLLAIAVIVLAPVVDPAPSGARARQQPVGSQAGRATGMAVVDGGTDSIGALPERSSQTV
jgi:fucose permease